MSLQLLDRAATIRRFADALVSAGLADDQVVESLAQDALSSPTTSFSSLVIARAGVPTETALDQQARLSQLPVINLHRLSHDIEPIEAPIPVSKQREFGMTIVGTLNGATVVAFADPPSEDDLVALREAIGGEVAPTLAAPRDVLESWSLKPDTGQHAAVPDDDAEITVDHLTLDELLRYAVKTGASDLHLSAGRPAGIRLNGTIMPIPECPILDPATIKRLVYAILSPDAIKTFEEELELDVAYAIEGYGRFRVNVFVQRSSVSAVLRAIPQEIPTLDQLSIPQSIRDFTKLKQGVILVTGVTGSGKSTTLAALIDVINTNESLHILTIEDPIEFLHNHKRSIVNQREVGQDTHSFAEALKHALREDPDVILVGEMRDLETTQLALTAAETGHLVFATLHSQDATQTVDRIIDQFPAAQQEQIRTMLGAALKGVVSQHLVKTADGKGRVAAFEVMVCTPAISNLIRSGKGHQIHNLIELGRESGMNTMDQYLAGLVHKGTITLETAIERCHNKDELDNHLRAGELLP